ncbi:MAG: T9SS type A sorting domain-containing protein [Bacteroidetes bacterium]|nr:T9SS type A sorting domain-containing protein [Bacteroidota bacterium]
MLTIPFFDDFSGKSIFPNDSLWADKNVFINTSYSYLPITVGVATFDALNDTGALYSDANSYGFAADTLTSNPIRLDSVFGISPDKLNISDSVYFSFYYQPQGIGNAPEEEDSLVLEFYSPDADEWNYIWSSPGLTLAEFHTQTGMWFKQVTIHVDSAKYFHKGFRFRFYNYSSLAINNLPSWAGNVDQWNIDYVYLDKDRNKADSIYKDVAFVEPAPSMLKNYYSMPWTQFNTNPSGEIEDTLRIKIANMDDVLYYSSYKYDIYDATENLIHTYNGGSYNIYPFTTNGYQDYQPHAKPPVDFSFPLSTEDSTYFKIEHFIDAGISIPIFKQNDTVIYNQNFYNYYAYDDGVPEAGYGLSPANSTLAYMFTLNHPDTLRAVRMFFNRTLNNASQQYFHLMVWSDANSKPDQILYEQIGVKPSYMDSLNKFYTYRLETPLTISGTFYVGWKQLTDDNLNIGFDNSRDEHNNIFFNTGNGWQNTNYSGALMIRPVLGKKLPLYAVINETADNSDKFKIYPNPTSREDISIIYNSSDSKNNSKLRIRICDLIGNEVCNLNFVEKINISNLQNGMYMLYINSPDNSIKYFTKLIIVK